MTQTVEQFLFEQLEKIAPGKYAVQDVLRLFKNKLRFSCTHLKGGRTHQGPGKDYNLSIFTFPNGVIEIKCLYNCGLKIRSDEKELTKAFNELYDLPTSNSKAAAEQLGKLNPGPVPTYSDEYRQRIRESGEVFWNLVNFRLANGLIKIDDQILGTVLPHPNPVEAPESIVGRTIKQAYQKIKDRVPASEPVSRVKGYDPEPLKTNTKIRKSRKASKTQSRRKSG